MREDDQRDRQRSQTVQRRNILAAGAWQDQVARRNIHQNITYTIIDQVYYENQCTIHHRYLCKIILTKNQIKT